MIVMHRITHTNSNLKCPHIWRIWTALSRTFHTMQHSHYVALPSSSPQPHPYSNLFALWSCLFINSTCCMWYRTPVTQPRQWHVTAYTVTVSVVCLLCRLPRCVQCMGLTAALRGISFSGSGVRVHVLPCPVMSCHVIWHGFWYHVMCSMVQCVVYLSLIVTVVGISV